MKSTVLFSSIVMIVLSVSARAQQPEPLSLDRVVSLYIDKNLQLQAARYRVERTQADQIAARIVQLAAPYASFPPDIRRDTDILHITRTWTFTRGDALTSSE